MDNLRHTSIQKLLGFLVTLLVVVGLVLVFANTRSTSTGQATPYLSINDRLVSLDLVTKPDDLARGLSGRESLEEDTAMVFVFPTLGKHAIWMKDMLFPIDIVWLDDTKKVVHLEANVQPESYPDTFRPDTPARYVLELSAGSINDLGITLDMDLVIGTLPTVE